MSDGFSTDDIVRAMLDGKLNSATGNVMFWFLLVAEYLPFIMILICTKISYNGEINYL